MKPWTKREAQIELIRDDCEPVHVSGVVYRGEEEQRYESRGSPPSPATDDEICIDYAWSARTGADVTLTEAEETEAQEQLREYAYDDDNYL